MESYAGDVLAVTAVAAVAAHISVRALIFRSLSLATSASLKSGVGQTYRDFPSLANRSRTVKMPSQERTLTPEQIALSIERKRKKAEAALKAPSAQKPVEGVKILERKWLTSSNIKEETITNSITVMTWNVCDSSIEALLI